MTFARAMLPFLFLAAPATAQTVADDPMPVAPAMVAASFATPPRAADGRYATPNRDLSAPEALWHLRVALNVAALGCRDADEVATVAGYNALLARGRDPLAAAQAGMAIVYRQRHGAAAQARNDDAMTRLYNFFAQPTGHDGFCAAAKAVLLEAAVVEPAALNDYAIAALPRLEAPFLAFFATWDGYRTAMAGWQARHAPARAPVLATASAAPIVPAPAAPPVRQVTVVLTDAALAAIAAGDVPGVTIAPLAPPAVAPAPTPTATSAAPVQVASVPLR